MNEEIKIEEIEKELSKELINIASENAIEFSELTLDCILNNEIVKAIPVLRTIQSVYKIGLNIRERFFAKKLALFINSLRSRKYNKQSFYRFREKLYNKQFREKVAEKLIITLDYQRDEAKIKYVTNLFYNFVNEKITWEEFCRFTYILEFMEEQDLELLEFLEKNSQNAICISISEKKHLDVYASKLVVFGLINQTILYQSVFGIVPATIMHQITEEGLKFIKYIY